MKSNVRPQSLYFSAYPLKAIQQETAKNPNGQSPYLKAILSGKTKAVSRVRVLPMSNPYAAKRVKFSPKPGQLPKDIEQTEKGWFNNYE